MIRWMVCAFVLCASAAAAQDTPRVVVVNHALEAFAEALAGEDAEVVFPVPEGVDPSFWRPGISDISAIQSADLILLSGAGFATWTSKVSLPRSRLVDTSRGYQDRLISTETITHSHGDGGAHSHEGTASYTWLDPELAEAQARAVGAALVARGLVEEATAEARMQALAGELAALAELELPATGASVIVATHPRYQYLARAFGLEIAALDWEAGAAPDAAQLAELKALSAEGGVLIWEADPGAEARSAVQDLGFADTVFPPLATTVEGSFAQSYRTSMETLAEAMSRASGS